MSNDKIFYHEIVTATDRSAIKDCLTWGDVMDKFKQPDWCVYPEALAGQFGCWSLLDGRVTGREFCANYDLCIPLEAIK